MVAGNAKKENNMDRELDLINGLADLTKIVAGLQTCIEDLTESCYILKARIEALEAKKEAL